MDELTDIFGSGEQSSNNNQNAVTDSAVLDIFGSSQNNAQDSFVIDNAITQEPSVISMDQLIEENKTNTTKVVKKKDKILIVQLVLIVIWVLATVLVYYFGYDFFEPFINV